MKTCVYDIKVTEVSKMVKGREGMSAAMKRVQTPGKKESGWKGNTDRREREREMFQADLE
jgi:hypothetical protein